jgi:hypothetical protein
MTLNYTTWQTQLLNAVAGSSLDANWAIQLPNCIDYAEQRIYRDLDMGGTRVTDNTGVLTVNTPQLTLPSAFGTFVVTENVYVVTPSSVTITSSVADIIPLVPASYDFINAMFPNPFATAGVPEFWAPVAPGPGLMQPTGQIIVGPAPALPYPVSVWGTVRPAPLSVSNSSTILTQLLPDLFYAATMISAAGYMRDFGQQSDNPQLAQSWEQQYTTLFKSAQTEEARKMMRSQGWTAYQPLPQSTPARV